MRKSKAIMIGAGIANMAAAVYLIQEGNWRGDQITRHSSAPCSRSLSCT